MASAGKNKGGNKIASADKFQVYRGVDSVDDIIRLLSPTYYYDTSAEAGDNVYNDWEDLIASLALAADGPKFIELRQNESVPAGEWDLHEATFRGTGAFGELGVFLTFEDGATITNPGRWLAEGGITLHSESTEPVYFITGTEQVYLENDASVVCEHCEFFHVTATDGLVLFTIRNGGGFFNADVFGYDTSYEIVNYVTTGATVVVAVPSGNGRMNNNTLRSSADAGSYALAVAHPAMGVTNPFLPREGFSHANAAGGLFELLMCFSENIFYDNSTSGMSAGNVQAAIDELAAEVFP